jgi:hypothetical protein
METRRLLGRLTCQRLRRRRRKILHVTCLVEHWIQMVVDWSGTMTIAL